ncbi:hypothetical protein BVRB_6g135360 [Beta vulgaris subsp. vulgaris]|nr:hypothetical protein BVRB_6g135360 [Beta vulgaris subsp. vulgaris]
MHVVNRIWYIVINFHLMKGWLFLYAVYTYPFYFLYAVLGLCDCFLSSF